jgi:transitional endoplasmic reticulum ATPase
MKMDGVDNNDGILLIATTNHLDRLDNSVKNRPSRFDRKYLFDDPDEEERRLYCGYWQKKLASNQKVSFPDSLADEIANKSDGLSFAYLKEALYVGHIEFSPHLTPDSSTVFRLWSCWRLMMTLTLLRF